MPSCTPRQAESGIEVAVSPGDEATAGNAAARRCGQRYYSQARPELVGLVPLDCVRILEVGCGEGALASALRATRKSTRLEIVGVELVQACAVRASEQFDRLFVGDIEHIELPYKDYFDCVLFGDVLEHLVDPWRVLGKASPWLRSGGCVVASLPNVQHWSVVAPLLAGRWDYRESGVMDRTHLRFFTRKSVAGLFREAGYVVRHLAPAPLGRLSCWANRLSIGLLAGFLARQYLVLAEPHPQGRNV